MLYRQNRKLRDKNIKKMSIWHRGPWIPDRSDHEVFIFHFFFSFFIFMNFSHEYIYFQRKHFLNWKFRSLNSAWNLRATNHISLQTGLNRRQLQQIYSFPRMRIPFIFCTLCARAILTAAARLGETEELWKVLSVAFGAHLQTSFGHPKTFDFASIANPLSITDSGYRVLCTDYTRGQLIGTYSL